ncbi:MAG: DEAD/DEAH box helicase [Verrucomicrobiaceae bacterium]|nr:DEAD/DEAH box helicase [Verrucomicrobiaceae bacterium]
MSDLLTKLDSLAPASLWTLAPRDLLMKGAGLLATGDIADLHWTGEGLLEFEFPQRLNTLIHRMWLAGDRIEGQCDMHPVQPCAHHLASLMLCMHLMKDFTAFGRLPNRVLAQRLKARLLKHDERAVVTERPAQQAQKHVLIRPQGGQLFTFRDSFSSSVQDAFATLPIELRTFINTWGNFGDSEDAFWTWFTRPNRRFPVFVDHEGKVIGVEPAESSRWRGGVVLDLDGSGLRMRRQLLLDGQETDEPFVPVGQSLACLLKSKKVIRLPSLQSWELWHEINSRLIKTTSLGFGSPYAALRNSAEQIIDIEDWNGTTTPWAQDSSGKPARLPRLRWKGEDVSTPTAEQASASIELMPTPGLEKAMLDVLVKAGTEEIELDVLSHIIHAEGALELYSADPQLLAARSRREAVMSTLFRIVLEPDAKERRALLRELEKHDSMRSPGQSKRAIRGIKETLGLDKEQTEPAILCSSSSRGWLAITGATRQGEIAAALARHLLGADQPAKWESHERSRQNPDLLMVPAAEALPRLPLLVEACQKHQIRLTYAHKPVAVTSLNCRVSATQSEGLDFFELRPEVTCAGNLIPQDQWEELLRTGHLIDDDGQLRVIDLSSIQGLSRVSDLLHRQRDEEDEPEHRKRKSLSDLVRIPRVRILDWLLLQKHGIECELPASERSVLESLMTFETLHREALPTALKATLRDYQHAGYSWLAFLYRHGFGGCLADDMGLGKTLQTITLLAAIKEGVVKPLAHDEQDRRPHLLVVPPTLLFNWQHEVKTFCPGLYVHEYTGKGRSLIGIRDGIVITTYDIARRDIESLREKKFDCIIFDEAQNVKNMQGERAKAMRQLEGRCKLTLTGTPLENHAGEYYSIIDLSLPGLFGDYREFMNALKQPNGIFNPLDRARPFVLRRTKEKILTELPPKVESDLHLDLTEEQKRFYTRAVADVRAEVFEAFQDKTAQQAGIVALAALTRLRQICVSPTLIDPTHTEMSPKMEHLVEKLEELNAEGHSALVFSQFTKCLDLLETHLKSSQLPFQRLDGSTPQQHRKKLVEAFQNGTGPGLFLISLKAGGAGLNLTRASYVFHIDPWWNPAAESQASDRAHRMGQKQTVFIQRLIMRHTIEEKIMQLKAQKRELFDQVLAGTEGDRSTGGAIITKEDFKFLLE